MNRTRFRPRMPLGQFLFIVLAWLMFGACVAMAWLR